MTKGALAHRKPVFFGATVIGAVLVTASVAFACVQTRGEIFVTAGNGTSTGVGNGHHPGAGPGNYLYCQNGKYLKAGATAHSDRPPGRGTFAVSLGTPPADCQFLEKNPQSSWIGSTTVPNVFPDGTYEVYFCQGQTGQPAFAGSVSAPRILNTLGSCFFSDGVTDYGTLVGTIAVTGNTAAPKTFNVPFGAFPTPAGTFAGVSVRRTGPGSCNCGPPPVNMAPIAMI